MKKPIHQHSIGYNILRAYVLFYHKIFYRKITVVGRENIPKDTPVVFAINHQNALMDALIVLGSMKQQPTFMARSDIFKGNTAIKFLRFIKILPIYRIRDGIKSLQNNDAVFEEAIAALEDKKVLGILPEGNHMGQKRLRVLKKGVARIIFKAEERNNFDLNVKVIPVGLDYSHYINFGSDLLINFGKPFDISQYLEEYSENDQKGMNSFMVDLRERMLEQMLSINDSENYNGIKAVVDFFSLKNEKVTGIKSDHLAKIKYQQKVSDKIIDLKDSDTKGFESLVEKGNELNKLVDKLKFRPWVLKKEKYSFTGILFCRLLQILFFPVYLYGFITNIIQFQLPVFLSRKVKDPIFLRSFRYILGVVIFTLIMLIYLIPLFILFSPLIAIALALSVPVSGVLAFKYYVWFKKTSAKFRNNRLRRKQNADWLAMRKNWNDIMEYLDTKLKA